MTLARVSSRMVDALLDEGGNDDFVVVEGGHAGAQLEDLDRLVHEGLADVPVVADRQVRLGKSGLADGLKDQEGESVDRVLSVRGLCLLPGEIREARRKAPYRVDDDQDCLVELVLVDGFRLCQIQIRLELPGAGFITLQSQPEQAFVVHGQVGIARVQLLPFHQMGERKYEFLNRPYELTGVKALHPEDLEDYRKIFLDHGIDCFF